MATADAKLDDDPVVEPLYEAPPAEFVATRKRIVAALKQAGRGADAKAIEKLARPPLQVWTANQVARRDAALVKRLIGLTDRLKTAGGADYAAAAAELRQLSAELRDSAGNVLGAAGHGVDPQILQRVLATLRAAVASAEHRPLLESGRLLRDVDEPEAATLFGHGSAPAASEPSATPAARKPAAAAPAPAAPSAEARQRERERARERAAVERRIEKLAAASVAARKELDKAERADADARKAAALVADRLARARQHAADAARELEKAEAELGRLADA